MRALIIHRPSGPLGGDVLIAEEFADALARAGIDVVIRSANDLPKDLSVFDAAHMYAACSPDWGLQAALNLYRAGLPFTVTPLWYPRDARQEFYGKSGDIYPGYTQSVAEVLRLSSAIAATTMGELRECWKLAPRHDGFVLGRGFTPFETPKKDNVKDYCLSIARIEPHKNQSSLALACAYVGLPLICIGPIGDASYAQVLEANGAIIPGEVSRREAMIYLQNAKVHALPSFGEIVSGANCEAAYLGIPFVVGLGYDWEYFGDRAVYCDPADWRDIAQALVEAANRPRRPWKRQPTWDSVAQRWKQWLIETR